MARRLRARTTNFIFIVGRLAVLMGLLQIFLVWLPAAATVLHAVLIVGGVLLLVIGISLVLYGPRRPEPNG